MSESVARNTGFALATQIVTSVFTAALTLVLVRVLGPEDFGLFSLALAISGLLLLPSDLGISQSVGRFIAERRDDPAAQAALLGDALRIKLLTGSVVSLVLVALAEPIAAAYEQPGLATPLRLVAIAMFGQSLMTLWSSAFISVGTLSRNLRLVASESLTEASASIAIVALAGTAGGAAAGRAIGYVAGALIGLSLTVRLFGRGMLRRSPGSRARIRQIVGYAGALLAVNVAFTVFNQADVLIVGAILGPAAVGVFTAPLRLTAFLHYPGLAISNSVSPLVAGPDPDVATFQRALRWLVVLQAAIVAPLIAWAEPVASVFGDDYGESADVLRALAPYVFLQGIGPLVTVSVNYLGEARRRVPIAVLAVVINLTIDIALLREIGVVAAAIGTSVAYAFYVPAHLLICRRLLGIPLRPLGLSVLRSGLACGAAVAVMLAFTGGGVSWIDAAVGAPLAALAFAGVVLVTGEVRPSDLRVALDRASRRIGRK